MESDNLSDEFREFLSSGTEPVPMPLTNKLRDSVWRDLHPGFRKVLGKLALVQLLAGTASLMICPQFGFTLTEGHGLAHYLLRFGEQACMLGCGALFTGLSLLSASLLLRPEEVRELRSRRLLQVLSVSGLSLAAFICGGAEVVGTVGLFWLIGALLGGVATLELGWGIRRRLAGQLS